MITQNSAKIARSLSNSELWRFVTTLVGLMSWKVALALGLMVSFSLAEGMGLILLVPLLELAGLGVEEGNLGQVTRFVSSIFGALGVHPTLMTVLITFVAVMTLRALLERWQSIANFSLRYQFETHLRQDLYRAIANTNWLFFSRNRSSDFTHALTTEVERTGRATMHLLQVLSVGLVTLTYLLFAFNLSPIVTGYVLTCGVILLVFLRGKARESKSAGTGLSQAMRGLYAAASEHLEGMKIAKCYGTGEQHADSFASLTEEVQHMYMSGVRTQVWSRCLLSIGAVVFLSAFIYASLEFLNITAAEALLLIFLFSRVMPRFTIIQQGYQQIVNEIPSFSKISEMQLLCNEAAEPTPQRPVKVEFRDSVKFEHVSFSYEDNPVIRDLNLTIRAGETVALVGPSGAGKSTVADLILGLISPVQGRVVVDGAILSPERLQSWREQIGYVTQDTFMFHNSIRANLLWACPDATEEEILQVLETAAAIEVISKLPGGLETIVGDRAIRLSAGEKQRLCLARALLRKPKLLILDEATNALDTEYEQRMLKSIKERHRHMTILIISHRLSTVREADVIYVLEEGRLVESGKWDAIFSKENGEMRKNVEVVR